MCNWHAHKCASPSPDQAVYAGCVTWWVVCRFWVGPGWLCVLTLTSRPPPALLESASFSPSGLSTSTCSHQQPNCWESWLMGVSVKLAVFTVSAACPQQAVQTLQLLFREQKGAAFA